jgi:hypothetical protein
MRAKNGVLPVTEILEIYGAERSGRGVGVGELPPTTGVEVGVGVTVRDGIGVTLTLGRGVTVTDGVGVGVLLNVLL